MTADHQKAAQAAEAIRTHKRLQRDWQWRSVAELTRLLAARHGEAHTARSAALNSDVSGQ